MIDKTYVTTADINLIHDAIIAGFPELASTLHVEQTVDGFRLWMVEDVPNGFEQAVADILANPPEPDTSEKPIRGYDHTQLAQIVELLAKQANIADDDGKLKPK